MTDLCATNPSRGNCKILSSPTSPTPALCPNTCPVPKLASLPASSPLGSEQDPELRPKLIFPKLFLNDQDPKAQHGPLPPTSSQAEEQRLPHQVWQNHSMMLR